MQKTLGVVGLALVTLLAGACGKDGKDEPKGAKKSTGAAGAGQATEKREQAPAAAKEAPAPAASEAGDPSPKWERLDMAKQNADDPMALFLGTIEVPAGATAEFFRSRGLEGLPVNQATIKTGDLEIELMESGGGGPDASAKSLADLKKRLKISPDLIVGEVDRKTGFAAAYGREDQFFVIAVYSDFECTAQTKDKAAAQTALRICASYQPAAE